MEEDPLMNSSIIKTAVEAAAQIFDQLEKTKKRKFILDTEALLKAFAPAKICLYEFEEYWLKLPEGYELWIGDKKADKSHENWFPVQFKNQLGLAEIRAVRTDRQESCAVIVEVISGKYDSPQKHLDFYQTLLQDLFKRAAQLDFTIDAPTRRGVQESFEPPSPMFVYHFLTRSAQQIEQAINIVLGDPHRLLIDFREQVPLEQVSQIGPDFLENFTQASSDWVKADRLALPEALQNKLPARFWQVNAEETFNTPENRFVLAFLRQIQTAAEGLESQLWWNQVPEKHKDSIHNLVGLIRLITAQTFLLEVGQMHQIPYQSQVLLRRAGYRECLSLYQAFHQSRQPVFQPLQEAINVRNVAYLYEIWTFFKLIETIQEVSELKYLRARFTDKFGLDWKAYAKFGNGGVLHFNLQFRQPNSYSLPLQPDFIWVTGGYRVVLDAKFRMRFVTKKNSDQNSIVAAPEEGDIHKMHTYKDALKARAAVILYPGDKTSFYPTNPKSYPGFNLQNLLSGSISGVGAMSFKVISEEKI